MPRVLWMSLLLSLGIASSASAVTIEWTPIGSPGNACDPQSDGCYGSVGYEYRIGTYEVSNAEYTEFLNAVGSSDPGSLYYASLDIIRTGSPGSYSYSVNPQRADLPVLVVTHYDALRFANWMHNGQPTGEQNSSTTESGAYTITALGISSNSISRNPGARFFLPTDDEWYKAAYYDAAAATYYDYPTGSNTAPTCTAPTAAPNSANCSGAAGNDDTARGSYTGSASPYGTFDQGGNAWELTETIPPLDEELRNARGGASYNDAQAMRSGNYDSIDPSAGFIVGFRLAMIPEPGTGLLVLGGLIGLAGWRRARA
jgi:formylglycine-generating enzyme required for sulfatase activity